jgi:hypothetical protein
MIIRIIGQGQFEVNSSLFDDLNKIDNTIVDLIEKGDEDGYKKCLAELIGLIKSEGKKVPDKELIESSIIVPPSDMTLEEARQVFIGDGIFKG